MIVMTFKLHDSSTIDHLPKWNARIYKGEKFLFTPEEFFGDTEEEARLKAKRWIKDISSDEYRARMTVLKPADIKPERSDNGPGRGHHFAGKVWMRHKDHGLARINADLVDVHLSNGWYKSGPRSKA